MVRHRRAKPVCLERRRARAADAAPIVEASGLTAWGATRVIVYLDDHYQIERDLPKPARPFGRGRVLVRDGDAWWCDRRPLTPTLVSLLAIPVAGRKHFPRGPGPNR